jgi:two-component system response regulator PilR (NtrC family)
MNALHDACGRILIADDEGSIRDGLVDVLTDEGYDVTGVADGVEAVNAIAQCSYDVVVTDLRMPGADGLEVLRRVRELSPQSLVLLITAYASVETAIEALRNGAHDYILKPLLLEDVLSKIHRLLEYRRLAWETQMLRREIASRYELDQMVIRSPAMREIFELIQKVGPTNRTVLITGESGVGKESGGAGAARSGSTP